MQDATTGTRARPLVVDSEAQAPGKATLQYSEVLVAVTTHAETVELCEVVVVGVPVSVLEEDSDDELDEDEDELEEDSVEELDEEEVALEDSELVLEEDEDVAGSVDVVEEDRVGLVGSVEVELDKSEDERELVEDSWELDATLEEVCEELLGSAEDVLSTTDVEVAELDASPEVVVRSDDVAEGDDAVLLEDPELALIEVVGSAGVKMMTVPTVAVPVGAMDSVEATVPVQGPLIVV